MTIDRFVFLLPYLLSLGLTAWVGWKVLPHNSTLAAHRFTDMCAFEALWTLGFIFQLVSKSLTGMLFWNNVQFIGAAAIPIIFLMFTLQYNYRGSLFQNFNPRYLYLIAAAMLVIIWTDPWTGWFRQNAHIVMDAPFSKLVFDNGVLFPVYTIYAFTFILLGSLVLVINWVMAPRIYRPQISLVSISVLIPWITSILTAGQWINVNLHQVMPLTFGISNLFFFVAQTRYKIFDLVPIARDVLIEKMKDAVVVLDATHRVIDLNPAAQRLINDSLVHLMGKPIQDILPDDAQEILHLFEKGQPKVVYTLHRDAQSQVFEIESTSLYNTPAENSGYLWIARDITEQKKNEQILRRSIVLTEATMNSTLNGIVVVDREFNIILANEPLQTIFSLPDHWTEQAGIWSMDLLGQQISDPNLFYSRFDELEKSPNQKQTIQFELTNGRAIEWTITPYQVDGVETGWLFSFRDITEYKKATDALREMANSDSLTGIANRGHFFQLAQQELTRSKRHRRPLALVLMDIDHFKLVNDSWGHQCGDQVLQTLAQTCRSQIRSFDTVGRYGGEEFIFLLPETDLTEAGRIAERLRLAIQSSSVERPHGAIKITVSMGVAGYIPDSTKLSFDELINAADRALYIAKDHGRNCVAYSNGDVIPRGSVQ